MGWFILQGNDPSCSETSTVSCDDLELPTGYTELTPDDLAGLAPVGQSNEYVLRFEQKRQFYRKLKENPALTSWNTDVGNFYSTSQSNIVGAIHEVDEAWRNLSKASATVSTSYEALLGQLDDLNEAVADVYATYPGASPAEQAEMLEDLREWTTQMLEIEADIRDLSEQELDERSERLDALLTLNNALSDAETWETEEKSINNLFFRYLGGLIDTFTSTQRDQIGTLAEECPQFYGAGVYKARFLREQIEGFSRHYFENHCVGEEERLALSQEDAEGQAFVVLPNPASDRVSVRLPQNYPHVASIEVRSLDGLALSTQKCRVGGREQTIDVSAIQPGVYWLTLRSENAVLLSAKLVIIR
ncbi:MAG: T9SS type A sorting domain-containing protein [Saprospiraceae bacterium]|nr:T9SS type A sorting domain-containing protein [Saprospiraceae bacterium]